MTQYLVPIEANINQDYPHAVQLTPRTKAEAAGGSFRPFVLPTSSPLRRKASQIHLHPHDSIPENGPYHQCISEIYEEGPDEAFHNSNDGKHWATELGPDQEREILKEMSGQPHPGFILLSVRHEKINNGSNDSTGRQPSTSSYVKKPSFSGQRSFRHRVRKQTSSAANAPTEGNGHGAVSDVRKAALETREPHSPHSRFRVTRIADSSSWWIPERVPTTISVHDLKTSTLPEFVNRQAKKAKSIYPSEEIPYDELRKAFWNHLEPGYLPSRLQGEKTIYVATS